MTYRMGDKTATVNAPYIAKVPAGVPHAFINAGEKPLHLIAVFPSNKPEFKILGPNPLIPPNRLIPPNPSIQSNPSIPSK